MEEIPNKIQSICKDKNWSLDFIFESIPCDHTQDAKEYEKLSCIKCNCDKREAWLEQILEKQNPDEKVNSIDIEGNPTIITLKKITVVRGLFDDCIGIQKEFD